MTEAEAIALLADPDKLIRRCYLHIIGGGGPAPANGQAEFRTFLVQLGHQTVSGFTSGLSGLRGITKDRPFVKFVTQPGPAQVPPPPAHFNAYYVPMSQVGDAANNTGHYTLPIQAGAIMITSKLSGCTFGVGSDAAGAVLVSHVQPNINAQPGSAALATAVQTGMQAVRGAFRKTREYGEFAAVIGRCSGGRWRFYMQASQLGGGGPGDPDYVISSSRRM